MGILLNEISEIKFYNAKTGEEVLPIDLDDLKVDKNKELELEKLRQQTGYHFPELCPNCGQYYEGYNGHYEIDGDVKCCHCVKIDERLNLPFFAPEIPSYVDGATRRIFTFTGVNDLYNKMKSKLSEGDILVKSDTCIMSQSITKSYWWVFGYINNFDMELLNIPNFNDEIYNKDDSVNVDKMNDWIEGKEIVRNDEYED